jgi:hypothetical protein
MACVASRALFRLRNRFVNHSQGQHQPKHDVDGRAGRL